MEEATGGGSAALLQHHLTLASDLCDRCKNYGHVKGASKLLKKCQSELKFLQGLARRPPHELRECHLRSSNLSSLEGIVVAMETLPHVTSILQPFPWSPSPHPLVVDLVCNQGYTWVKVVARKAQAIHLVWAGGGQFGERDLVHQMGELMTCAQSHPVNFKIPEVLVVLTAGVTEPVRAALCSQGVQVQAQVVPVDEETCRKLELVTDISDDDDDDDYEDDCNDILSAADYLNKKLGAVTTGISRTGGQCFSGVGGGAEDSVEGEGEILKSPGQQSIGTGAQGSTFPPGSHSLTNQHGLPRTPLLKVVPTETEVSSDGATGEATFEHPMELAQSGPGLEGPGVSVRDLMTSVVSSGSHEVVGRVNLDITTLIALVSGQCHGGANFIFKEAVLNRQAACERACPSLPTLQAFMAGKQAIACETAVADFKTILKTVGGTAEKARAEQLLDSLTVVPDQPSARAENLIESGKVKARAKAIFGTGDQLKAVTITANVGFIRAAKNQDITFAVYVHEPRALTEQKEETATRLPQQSEGTDPSPST